jgi:hypothetical protein
MLISKDDGVRDAIQCKDVINWHCTCSPYLHLAYDLWTSFGLVYCSFEAFV